MPPDGSWRPNVSLSSVLVSIQVLLGNPNLNDVVRPELIAEFSSERTHELINPVEKPEKRNFTLPMAERKRAIGLSLSLSSKKAKFQENKSDAL